MKLRNISGVDQKVDVGAQIQLAQRAVKQVKDEKGRILHKAQKAGKVDVPDKYGEKLLKTGDWEKTGGK